MSAASFYQVLIIPAAGFTTDAGKYTRGCTFDNLAEVDIVDRYVAAMVDELDNNSIRHSVQDTRKRPGICESRRHEHIFPNTLVLHATVGWSDKILSKLPTQNRSRVFFQLPAASELAHLLSEALGHWGQLYVSHEHKRYKPLPDENSPLLSVEGTLGIRLEPFTLNLPRASEYAQRLEQLGRDIGRTVADYVMTHNLAARAKPSTLDSMTKAKSSF